MKKLNDTLNELKSFSELVNNQTVDKETRDKITELRDQYTNISSVLNDEQNLKLLRRQIKRRKSKRKREYKKRNKASIDKILKEKAIEQKHAEIDKNLKLLNDRIKQEKQVQGLKSILF